MDDEFSPAEAVKNALHKWWLIALTTAVGGLLAILFFQLRQPIYEATVSFALGIDYTRTGPITQYDEDHALGMVGMLITSTRVKEEVVSTAQEQGIEVSFDQLHLNSILERKAHVWILRVHHPDPQTAADIANIWADVALARLEEAYQHAVRKELLERYASSITSCLETITVGQPVLAPCQNLTLDEMQSTLAQLEDEIFAEKQASYNIFPGLLFGEVTKAVVPNRPIRYGRGSLALAGMAMGLIAGLLIVQVASSLRQRLGAR